MELRLYLKRGRRPAECERVGRFIVRANDMLTALLELETAIF